MLNVSFTNNEETEPQPWRKLRRIQVKLRASGQHWQVIYVYIREFKANESVRLSAPKRNSLIIGLLFLVKKCDKLCHHAKLNTHILSIFRSFSLFIDTQDHLRCFCLSCKSNLCRSKARLKLLWCDMESVQWVCVCVLCYNSSIRTMERFANI